MAKTYHVAKTGNDRNKGTKEAPFLTIQRAADVAMPGDSILVPVSYTHLWWDPCLQQLQEQKRQRTFQS